MMAQMKGMKGENKKRNILTYGRERERCYTLYHKEETQQKKKKKKKPCRIEYSRTYGTHRMKNTFGDYFSRYEFHLSSEVCNCALFHMKVGNASSHHYTCSHTMCGVECLQYRMPVGRRRMCICTT